MRTLFILAVLLAALLCNMSFAHGQKATEQYIPIGQSPGLSGKSTYVGPIEAVDPVTQSIKIAGDHTVKISAQTRIWLDRSSLKLTNTTGAFTDLQPGRKAEVKFEDPERRDAAEWVKVELARP